MRRVGLEEYVEEAAGKLPDPIDLDRDQELLASYGLTRTQVLDRLGSSPSPSMEAGAAADENLISHRRATLPSAPGWRGGCRPPGRALGADPPQGPQVGGLLCRADGPRPTCQAGF